MSEIDNKHILGYGQNDENKAKPLGITGEENNKLITISLEEYELFKNILKELKKFNIQLEFITNTKLTKKDAESHQYKS